VLDGTRTGNKVNSKSWFYFSVEGFPKNTKGKFTVNKVQTLASVYYVNVSKRSSLNTIKVIALFIVSKANHGNDSKLTLN
jgi:hypothetical protein